MKLVFLGAPGAGKGTQAAEMAKRFDLEHASTGDIFRRAVAGGAELGATVKSYLDGGRLVPDELTARVVDRMVLEKEPDFILDGFPRTLPQARLLEEMLNGRGEELDGVIYFELGRDDALERLTGRVVCRGCGRNYHVTFMPPAEEGVCDRCGDELLVRSDSSREVVERRLREYEQKTEPLVGYYERAGLLKTVDAARSPSEVSRATEEVIKSLINDE